MRPNDGSSGQADDDAGGHGSGLSRRGFMVTAGAVATSAVVATRIHTADAPGVSAYPEGHVTIRLTVNGADTPLGVDPRTTLLDAVRERLGMTGTKKGCDRGQCGACTVHVDGVSVLSCLTLAVAVDGQRVTTVEGLADGDDLHPLQQAFIDTDAFQCGFCTSGQLMAGAALIDAGRAGEAADVGEAMSGNLCRCGAYPSIVAAVQDAAGAKRR